MKKIIRNSKIIRSAMQKVSNLSLYSIILYSLSIALILTFFISVSANADKKEAFDGEIVRLHVLANSDSESDQKLKLLVRDAVIRSTQSYVSSLTPKEAKIKIGESLLDIESAAKACLLENGSDYTVKVEWGVFPFPIKEYGDITLPKGNYRAVRVLIGEGRGKNWWCVMFPPLCFVDETKAEMPKESVNKLSAPTKDVLNVKDDKPKVEVRLKILEALGFYKEEKINTH